MSSMHELQTFTVVELVRAAQRGERAAFGELFERYRIGIVALAMRRMRNADEADAEGVSGSHAYRTEVSQRGA